MKPSARTVWCEHLLRVVDPPLDAFASGRLRASMPVQSAVERAVFAPLEAVARSLAGLAPWFALLRPPAAERAARERLHSQTLEGLSRALAPRAREPLDFTTGTQPLVDAAFLAHALLRAPGPLFEALDLPTRKRLLVGLRATRAITPAYNNWLLFSAMVEAALLRFDGAADLTRIDYALRQHEAWHAGDGTYSDGPAFHWDYYNSFVIHPMLLDVLETVDARDARWRHMLAPIRARAVRHAAVLERLIAPDGSFPPLGRSLAYRCGAFQLLAQMALRRELPADLAPGSARRALTAVIIRTLHPAGTFDDAGWLRIGLSGYQPSLGETYISTGSLYLCTVAFLPLGLAASEPFWSDPDAPMSSERAWSGEDLAADSALSH